jgi:hypothetical protein
VTNNFVRLIETRKNKSNIEEKPLYKLKMFHDVESKVRGNLKQFKTYVEKKDNIDNLIEKVESELNNLNNQDIQQTKII